MLARERIRPLTSGESALTICQVGPAPYTANRKTAKVELEAQMAFFIRQKKIGKETQADWH
jgi:hypothetical protein